ncbi:MAG TPA: SMP-30/gluconolactonase/LRE family protein [Cellvibrionaceae bacterium]
MSQVSIALNIRANLGECPRWDEHAQLLYWVDINNKQLHRFNPATGEDDFLTFEQEIGCFALRKQGGFVLAMRHGFYLLNGWNTELTFITDPEAHLDKNRFNDGRVDASGRLWAGSVYPPKDYMGASIYSLTSEGVSTRQIGDLLTANGIAFSPDNRTFYYADTPSHAIMAADFDLATGTINNSRVFHQFPQGQGRPDGGCVDSEGYYWTALYEGGRVVRLNPNGEITQEIIVPARCPTMPAFGDADLKTLYITSVSSRPEAELKQYPHSGAIFKVRVDVAGRVENRFLG